MIERRKSVAAAALCSLLLTGCAPLPRRAEPELKGPPTRTDAALQSELERLVAGFRGEVGIYVRHLSTGATAAIRPEWMDPDDASR